MARKIKRQQRLSQSGRNQGRHEPKMGHRHRCHSSSSRGGSIDAESAQGETYHYQRNPASLATKHNATIGCPITTGIFAWIAAHAAEEQKQQGKIEINPYWRTLKVRGLINEKYPGGTEAQTVLLQQEGHSVIKRGKNCFVKDYENALFRLDQ
jgi:hypothetical protein